MRAQPAHSHGSRNALVTALATGVLGSGCEGPQSILVPAGEHAARLATFFWWMTGGTVVIWTAVVAITLYAGLRQREQVLSAQGARRFIFWGGAVFPTVVIAGLLGYGLFILPEFTARSPEGTLRVAVTGEQWWWRVRYLPADSEPVPLANELWLPVGEPVEFELDSPDVVHSFWIPSLGGKMDMIPGRRTRLRLDPTQVGTFRGVCAEFCGDSHAYMGFMVKVVPKHAFTRWLQAQAQPAAAPGDPLGQRGQEVFEASGCGACHAVRGTEANGVVGPDLTHVGSRLTIAALRLENSRENLRRWVAETHQLKPAVLMPAFGMLPPEDLDALATYLEGLK